VSRLSLQCDPQARAVAAPIIMPVANAERMNWRPKEIGPPRDSTFGRPGRLAPPVISSSAF